MPTNPESTPGHEDAPDGSGTSLSRGCRRDQGCGCAPGSSGTSDLATLMASPGFTGTVLGVEPAVVGAHLPHLDQVVGVTVAGPVGCNDVGAHEPPVHPGGPIRCDASRITLRLNPARLGSALITEPAAHVPPTLRFFDVDGNTAHATYLTELSDRLAFESIGLGRADPSFADAAGLDSYGPDAPASWSTPTPVRADDDQITQFDSILADGGVARRTELPGLSDAGFRRVDDRQVIAALEHAALLGMAMTTATCAPGCIQMRHDQLDGPREHRGQMVVASGRARAMINFGLVAESWITWSDGVWGRTGSIELYDRHGACSLVLTQTGPVPAPVFAAWDHLLTDLVA